MCILLLFWNSQFSLIPRTFISGLFCKPWWRRNNRYFECFCWILCLPFYHSLKQRQQRRTKEYFSLVMIFSLKSPVIPVSNSYYNSCLEYIDISAKSKTLDVFTKWSRNSFLPAFWKKKGGRSDSFTKITLVIEKTCNDEESKRFILPSIKIK